MTLVRPHRWAAATQALQAIPDTPGMTVSTDKHGATGRRRDGQIFLIRVEAIRIRSGESGTEVL